MLKNLLENKINMQLLKTSYTPQNKPSKRRQEEQKTIIKTCFEIAEAAKIQLFDREPKQC